MQLAVRFPLLFLLVALVPATASAQWGDVAMTFTYDGKPPAAKAAARVKTECSFDPPVPDETWMVNPKGDVQNVVVSLLAENGVALPIHPSFNKAKGTAVRVDITKCRFEPHILIKYTNQSLIIGNTDRFGHNFNAQFFKNIPFNVLIPAMTDYDMKLKLDEPEMRPTPVVCGIHPHMKGYLFIHSHPYSGISDATGALTIKNVPQGEWTFVMWHESGGYIQSGLLGVAKTPTNWKKGRIKIKVGPGINTVGTVAFK